MKPFSIRGLFASTASLAILAGSLLSGCAGAANAHPEDTLRATPAAIGAKAKEATSSFALHQALPLSEAKKIMQQEGWKAQMYGYALLNDHKVKGVMTLFKQENSDKWRLVITTGNKAYLAYEGDKLALSEPLDPTRRLASLENGNAIPVNHPTTGFQGCGKNLSKIEEKVFGNIVAEGLTSGGKVKMMIAANYIGEEKEQQLTWAMYMAPVDRPNTQCRTESGFGITFTPDFKSLPPGYEAPQP